MLNNPATLAYSHSLAFGLSTVPYCCYKTQDFILKEYQLTKNAARFSLEPSLTYVQFLNMSVVVYSDMHCTQSWGRGGEGGGVNTSGYW